MKKKYILKSISLPLIASCFISGCTLVKNTDSNTESYVEETIQTEETTEEVQESIHYETVINKDELKRIGANENMLNYTGVLKSIKTTGEYFSGIETCKIFDSENNEMEIRSIDKNNLNKSAVINVDSFKDYKIIGFGLYDLESINEYHAYYFDEDNNFLTRFDKIEDNVLIDDSEIVKYTSFSFDDGKAYEEDLFFYDSNLLVRILDYDPNIDKTFIITINDNVIELEDYEFYELRDQLKNAYENNSIEEFINAYLTKYIETSKSEKSISKRA